MNHPLSDMMTSTMAKIKDMIDVNTVIGDPITTPDGVTIIPVTKVSIGYGSGGSDFAMSSKQPDNCFGGGAGGSVKITPIAFLIIRDGNVRMLPVAEPASTSMDREKRWPLPDGADPCRCAALLGKEKSQRGYGGDHRPRISRRQQQRGRRRLDLCAARGYGNAARRRKDRQRYLCGSGRHDHRIDQRRQPRRHGLHRRHGIHAGRRLPL